MRDLTRFVDTLFAPAGTEEVIGLSSVVILRCESVAEKHCTRGATDGHNGLLLRGTLATDR